MTWPIHALPHVRLAGRFFHADTRFSQPYANPRPAIHWYEYPCRMRIGEVEYALQAGMYSLSPAGVETRYHLDHPGHHWCIHFELDGATTPDPPGTPDDGSADDAMATLPLVGRAADETLPLEQRFARIALLHRDPRPAANRRARLMVQDLLLSLDTSPAPATRQTSQAPLPRHPPHPSVVMATDLIHRELDQPLDVPTLARTVGLSQNYLARLFKQHHGTSILGYQRGRRLARARVLLSTTNMPVKQIGAQVGITDPHHFNKLFRAAEGVSPSGYRARG